MDWNSFKLEKKLFCDCCSRGVNEEDWFWLFWPKLKLLPTLARRSLVVVAIGVDVGVGKVVPWFIRSMELNPLNVKLFCIACDI